MTASLPISPATQTAKLTARDFWLLADAGAFKGFVKAELIEGEIWVVNSVLSRHARAPAVLTGELYAALKGSKLVLLSTPSTSLSDDSIPEPDIAVTTKADGKAVEGKDVLVAVEISDSTLEEEMGSKMRLYARHGIPEYWVVDVEAKIIHQRVGPGADGYAEMHRHAFGATVSANSIAGLAVETVSLG